MINLSKFDDDWTITVASRVFTSQKLTHDAQTHDTQTHEDRERPVTIAYHEHFVLRSAKKQSANVVTGDETWVHYFEPVIKVNNKIWATKHSKSPIIAKHSLSAKKVLYAFFFSGEGVAIKVLVKKGKSITGKYYKDVVLKRLKKYYEKQRLAIGFKHVRLLHENAPAHTSAIVTAFMKKEKVTVLPHPLYSPDLAPCDFFLFPKLKSFLAGRKYQFRQALESAIHQYLITVPKSAYRVAFKKWRHWMKLCISSHGEYYEGMK